MTTAAPQTQQPSAPDDLAPEMVKGVKALLSDLVSMGERVDADLKEKKAAADYALAAAPAGEISQHDFEAAMMRWAHARGCAEGYVETLRIVAARFGMGERLTGRARAAANGGRDPAMDAPSPMPRAERRRYAKRAKRASKGKR